MHNKVRHYLYVLLLIVPVLCWAETTPGEQTSPERILWQKTPIELALSVGKEQRIDCISSPTPDPSDRSLP